MKPKFQNIQKSAKLEDNRKALRFSVKEIEGSPSFSFNHFSEKGYGIGDCRLDDYEYMIKKLKTLGKSDWNTINNSARHGLGFEKIDKKILNANLSAIINEIPENEANERYASCIIKLYDHLNIDITRIEKQKASEDANENLDIRFRKLENAETDLTSKIKKAEENLEKSKLDIVAILGIFSAIVIAFFGGFNYITAAISSINDNNVGSIMLTISVAGFVVFNTIVAVIRLAIRQPHEKESERDWILCTDVIIGAFIAIALILYLK